MTQEQFDRVTDVLAGIIIFLIYSGILMALNNYVIAELFSTPTITYLQTVLVYIGIRIVAMLFTSKE